MKWFLIPLGKSVLALLSVAGVLLLVLEGWLIWHVEYGIGLPTESRLGALPATGHLCSANSDSFYTPLAEIPLLIRNAAIVSEDADFYARPQSALHKFASAVVANRPPRWSNITFSVMRHCLHVLAPGCCRGLDWHTGSWVFMGRIERAIA